MGKVFLTAFIVLLMTACLFACNNNDEDSTKETKPKKEITECETHTYGDWAITTAATCTTPGTKKRICSVCKHEETDTYYADHTLTATAAVEATCTESGNVAYWTCSVCNKHFSDAAATREIALKNIGVEAKGHTLTHHTAVAATCTANGTVEYWSCSACGKNFSDSHGENVITSITTPKAAHVMVHIGGEEPTCDNEGVEEHYNCTACHKNFSDSEGEHELRTIIIPVKHEVLEAYAKVDATCTSEGNIAYWVCPGCSRYFSDENATREIVDKITTIPMAPHVMKYHSAVPNSCTQEGNIEYWGCENCTLKYSDAENTHEVVEVTIPKDSHNMTYHYAVDSTCTTEGNVAYYECSKCHLHYEDTEGENLLESIAVAKKAHSIKHLDDEDALSCIGVEAYYYCEDCGATYKDAAGTVAYIISGETSHTMVHTPAVEATCTSAGSREYWTCTLCQFKYMDERGTAIIETGDEIIDAYGHAVEHVSARAATCTEDGIAEHYYCHRCGQYFVDASAETGTTFNVLKIEKTGHTAVADASVAATCTKTGLTAGSHCSVCGAVITAQEITEKIPHDYVGGKCTQCEENKTISISFSAGSQELEEQDITANEAFTFPVPTKSGSYFVGWAIGTTVITNDEGKSLAVWSWSYDDSVEVTAVWEDDTEDRSSCARVTYYNVSGATNINNVYQIKGYDVLLADLTDRVGFTFVRWEHNDAAITYLHLSDANVALYAVWERKEYTISFDFQGGKMENPDLNEEYDELEVDIPYDTLLVWDELARPTKAGSTFLGWFLNVTDETPYAGTNMPAQNIKLYAKWEVYTIKTLEYTSLYEIKESDTLNGDLFGIHMVDSDGNETPVSVTVTIIEGAKEAGKTISVRIVVQGKYNKKRVITLTGIKVYGTPTLVFGEGENASTEPTLTQYSESDELDAAFLSASGKDSFSGDTQIVVYGETQIIDVESKSYSDLSAAEKAQTVPVEGGEALLYKEAADGSVLIREALLYGEEWEYLLTKENKKIHSGIIDDWDVNSIPDVDLEEGGTGKLYKADIYGYIMIRKPALYKSEAFEEYSDIILTHEGTWDHYETIVIRSVDLVGNYVEKKIENVKVYSKPVITLANEVVAVKADTEVTAELWGATAKDSFNTSLTVEFACTGSKTVGNKLTVTFTAEDGHGNETTITREVKVLGTPTLDRPTKTRFSESEEINAETLGLVAKDSCGDEIDIADIEVTKKDSSAPQVKGSYLTYTVVATDVTGNSLTRDITVMIYDKPIFTADDTTVAFRYGSDAEDAESFGVSCVDDFGRPLIVSVVLLSGSLEPGTTPQLKFTASNVAGIEDYIIRDCKVYSQSDIELTYRPLESNVVRVESDGSEFGASATGSNASECVITVLDVNGNKLVGGVETSIILRATDPAGNYKDSAVIDNIFVYDVPVVEFVRHDKLYLTSDEMAGYNNGTLTFAAMFTAKDSFNEDVDLSFTVTGTTETEMTVEVTSDPDNAGNVFSHVYTIAILAENQSILKLNVNGKVVEEEYRVVKNGNVDLPNLFEGYTFNGWKYQGTAVTGSDGKLTNWTEDADVYTLNADVTSKQYTVHLYVNDQEIGSVKLTYGTTFKLNIPSMSTGQSFVGWMFNNERITDGTGTSLGVWETANEVYFDADIVTTQSLVELYYADGTLWTTRMLLYGESFDLPVPSEAGYLFEGWSLGDTVITDKSGKSLAVWTRTEAKYTLRPRRDLVEYTITYNLNGGLNNPKNPSAYSVRNVGSGIQLSDPVKVTDVSETYTINYTNGGYDYTATYTIYEFDGWYAESTFVNRVRVITIEKGNVVLYAKWVETERTVEENYAYIYNKENGTVEFGSYPQTKVENSDLIDALSSHAATTPSSSNPSVPGWSSYGFYISGEVTQYIWYFDYTYTSEEHPEFNGKYRGVYFENYRPNDITELSSMSKSYQDDNGYRVGKIHWFKYEPIVWNILSIEDGTAFLYTDMILDSRQMNETDGVAYANSSISAWLNSSAGFFGDATLLAEAIVPTEIATGTNKNVFLLSKEDLCNVEYGFSASEGATDPSRRQQATDYAACLGAYISGSGNYSGNSSWWLRTDSGTGHYYMVGYNGSITHDSYKKTYHGIVPAIRVSSSLLFEYDSVNNGYVVVGYNGFEDVIEIPNEYLGEDVIAIGDFAFANKNVRHVTLPGTIRTIGTHAFFGCENLLGITLPASLESIDNKAFYGCVRLTTIVNKSSLEIVKNETNGYVAFYAEYIYGSSYNVTISEEGIIAVSSTNALLIYAFGTEDLVEFTDVTTIGKYAFIDSDKIAYLDFDEDLVAIDASSFANCTALTSVTIGMTSGYKWYYTTSVENWRSRANGDEVDLSSASVTASLLKQGGYFYKKLEE